MIALNKKVIIISAAGLVLIGLAAFGLVKFFSVPPPDRQSRDELPLIGLTENFYNPVNFSAALKIAAAVTPEKGIKIAIVPHHLLASEIDAKILRQASGDDYRTIVIIGPNHGNTAAMKVFSAVADWQTPEGNLAVDRDLTNKFLRDFGIISRPEVFQNEHSIGAIAPWVKHFWPRAKILPINLSVYADSGDAEKIASWLKKNLPPDSLVIGSMDFSHYLTYVQAEINDQRTQDLISNGEAAAISHLDANSFVDSPATLATLVLLAKSEGLNPEIVAHDNSFNFLTPKPDSTTSYFGIVYRPNKTVSAAARLPASGAAPQFNLLFFGDLMLDRHVGEKIKASGSLDWIFSDLNAAGIFQGNDFVSANLEGAVTDNGAHYPPLEAYDFAFNPALVKELTKYNFNYFNIANNHLADQGKNGIIETEKDLSSLGFNYAGCPDREVGDCTSKIVEINGKKIGLTGASMVYGALNENLLINKVKALASSTDFVIAQMHWGIEYQHEPAANQIALAHKLIDAGADIVIGHHPHVVGGLEIYQGKPIFYSLGNFVFDQYFSTDTQEELGVKFAVADNNFQINLLPIKSEASRLRLMTVDEKNKFLSELAGWSIGTAEFKRQIISGSLILKNN
ncbi:MAG TPA: AmmeMemoRadiSam system protein B [Candidatus Methylomirabilis sp.]|nr:AmmeMemoRadiSam system protein B [Candidatus Methylomirabilis sp.]